MPFALALAAHLGFIVRQVAFLPNDDGGRCRRLGRGNAAAHAP